MVNGNWVMQITGVPAGPELGRIINTTVQWILDSNIDLRDIDKIAEYIKGGLSNDFRKVLKNNIRS